MAAINVDKMSLKELMLLDAKLKTAIETKKARERSELKIKMAELAETHGFSVAELFGTPGEIGLAALQDGVSTFPGQQIEERDPV